MFPLPTKFAPQSKSFQRQFNKVSKRGQQDFYRWLEEFFRPEGLTSNRRPKIYHSSGRNSPIYRVKLRHDYRFTYALIPGEKDEEYIGVFIAIGLRKDIYRRGF